MTNKKSSSSFDPKIICSSAKPHICFGCEGTISTGMMYVRQVVRDDKTIKNIALCLLCAMLLKEQNRTYLKPGGFSDRLIPNCLRKKKAEFLDKFKHNSKETILEQIAK